VGAVIERIISDAGDAAGNRVASAAAARKLNQRGLALVEQHSVDTAVKRIVCIHCDRYQTGAAVERIRPDVGDAAGNADAGQFGAVTERNGSDAGDAAGNRDAAQAGAVIERITPDDRDAAGNADAGQAGATRERTSSDVGDAAGNRVASAPPAGN